MADHKTVAGNIPEIVRLFERGMFEGVWCKLGDDQRIRFVQCSGFGGTSVLGAARKDA